MSNKKLAILGVVAAVMLVWAVVQSKISNRTHKVTTKSRYLVTGVNVDDIDSIVVQSGKDKLTLKRRGSGFVIVNKDNYPAEAEKVNDLITDCLEVEVSQMVTDSPSNYEDLGVTEEKAQKVVHFLKPDGSELVGIIVGNTKDKGQGTYVRLTSNNEVFEASQAPWIETDPLNYAKKQLVALTRTDTAMVTVESPEGKYVLKPKTDGEDVELVNLPEGKKVKQADAKNVFTALSSLDFTDVKKKTGDLTFDRHYICKLFNSTEFTFDIAAKDDKTYVTCRAVFTEGITPPKPGEKLTDEQMKEQENKQKLDKKADDFTKRNMGWVYEIPSYKAKYMTMNLSDLVEDNKDVEAAATTPPDSNDVLNTIQQENPLN